jgi:hypothetical protein
MDTLLNDDALDVMIEQGRNTTHKTLKQETS